MILQQTDLFVNISVKDKKYCFLRDIIVICICTLLLLSGCQTIVTEEKVKKISTAKAVFKQSHIETDAQGEPCWIVTPAYRMSRARVKDSLNIVLRGYIGKEHSPILFQVYISHRSMHPVEMQQAFTGEGCALPVIPISQERIAYQYQCDAAILVPREELERAASRGLSLKIMGLGMLFDFVIPSHYVKGFLEAFDSSLVSSK